MTKRKIVIATRGRKREFWLEECIKSELEKIDSNYEVELNIIKTTGDKILDVPLAQVGGKGLFVKEIEEAMLRGEADLAVHSMKDVPTDLPQGLHLPTITKREDPRDAFIAGKDMKNFLDLPQGATVGTSSLRRICQLLNKRPDLRINQLRGNVDTRLRKLEEGQFDAIILATAGVKRLGHEDKITERMATNISLPAIGQGAVGIECRVDDEFINNLLAKLDHYETSVCVRAERAFLKKLEGGCQVPIAAYAQLIDGKITMSGLVGSVDGKTLIKDTLEGTPEGPETLGTMLAEKLLAKGAKEILDEVYKNNPEAK